MIDCSYTNKKGELNKEEAVGFDLGINLKMRAPSIFACLPGLAPHFLSQSAEKDRYLGGLSQKSLPPPPPSVEVLPSKVFFA